MYLNSRLTPQFRCGYPRVVFRAISLVLLSLLLLKADSLYEVDLTVAREGFDGKMCWVHARSGALPPEQGKPPLIVMTLQKLDISGSDIFYALNGIRTVDGGATWTVPEEHGSFSRAPFTWRNEKDLEITVCDFWPRWHARSGKLIGIGHTVVYEDNWVKPVRPRGIAYAIYNLTQRNWSDWRTVELPDESRFENAGQCQVGA